MSKCIILVTNFQKLPSAGTVRPQHLLTFDIGNLKLHDLVKLWFFKLIMMKSNFHKISYDVVSVTSSQLRHKNFHVEPSQSKFLTTPVKSLISITSNADKTFMA